MSGGKPVVLIILDGWGIAPAGPGNAITLAQTTQINRLIAAYPHTQLAASAEAVGLPHGEMGNSEVGHLNLGAGRVVYQDLTRINMMISEGTFWDNPALVKAIDHVKTNSSTLHLIGLIGPSGVHSSIDHLYALLRLCQKYDIPSNAVKIHVFTDGRDSPPQSSLTYIAQLESHMSEIGVGQIASVSGRFYAMDRDNRWDRISKAYRALVGVEGKRAHSAQQAVKNSYQEKRTDEFVLPTMICDNSGNPIGAIKDNDAVIFFNFRPDRSRQLTQSFVLEELNNLQTRIFHFDEKLPWPEAQTLPVNTFDRGTKLANLCFITMTEYDKDLPVSGVVLTPLTVELSLSQALADSEKRQLHIAETEKYYHVSYFFDGGRKNPFTGEDLALVPSNNMVATYDKKPEMSAEEITNIVCERISKEIYDFMVINFANGDMVGHTGVISAAITACQKVDECVGRIARVTLAHNGACVITADHGNVEEMINRQTGEIDTEHSTNPVPLIIAQKGLSQQELPAGILADVAPTILALMGIAKPPIMSGRNLLA